MQKKATIDQWVPSFRDRDAPYKRHLCPSSPLPAFLSPLQLGSSDLSALSSHIFSLLLFTALLPVNMLMCRRLENKTTSPAPSPHLLVLDNHSLVFLTSFFSSGRSAHGHNRLSPTCGLRSQTLRILPSCDPTPDSCLPTERSLDVGILKFSLFFSP